MANHTASHYAKDLSVSIDALLADDVSVKDFTRRLFNINYQRTRISDHELAKLMRACAIPRAFDAKIIGVLRGAPRAYKRNRQLLDGLKTFSFVQVRSDGYYVYHDNTRDVVLDDWRAVKNPNEFNRYKRRLLKFYVEQGQQCYESGKYAEALAEFHHAADLEPENGEIYCWLGMAHFELQDYNSALTDLNVA